MTAVTFACGACGSTASLPAYGIGKYDFERLVAVMEKHAALCPGFPPAVPPPGGKL